MMIHTIWAFAHPDDESLAAAVALAEGAAAGQNVHVLWLTAGTASGVRAQLNGSGVAAWWGVQHNPAVEGYQPLSEVDLGIARIAEAKTAVWCLAAGLPGTITVHEANLPDGQVDVDTAKAAILAVADAIAPGEAVRLKTHSWLVDDHPDHLAAGEAVRQLGLTYPGRLGDCRYYIESPYWEDPRQSQVTAFWDTPSNAEITARVRNAANSFRAWAPTAGAYAIGWHSVPTMFAKLDAAPKCRVHT